MISNELDAKTARKISNDVIVMVRARRQSEKQFEKDMEDIFDSIRTAIECFDDAPGLTITLSEKISDTNRIKEYLVNLGYEVETHPVCDCTANGTCTDIKFTIKW